MRVIEQERYADQVSKNLSYGKEIWEYRLEKDSIYGKLNYRLDEMEHNFDRMVSVMERLPEISDCMLNSLGQQEQEIMELMTLIVDETFNNVDYQRKEMQQYISEERKSILEEMRGMADGSLRTLLEALPEVVGRMAGWVILLVVVVFEVPFMAGFLPAESCNVITVKVYGKVEVSFPADADLSVIAKFVRKMGKEAGHVGT